MIDARRLLRLYPRDWRERYGDEFLALLDQRPITWRAAANIAAAACRERAARLLRRPKADVRHCPHCGAPLSRQEWVAFLLQTSLVSGARVAPCASCGALLRLSSARGIYSVAFGAALAVNVLGRFATRDMRLPAPLLIVEAGCFLVAIVAQRRMTLEVVPFDNGAA